MRKTRSMIGLVTGQETLQVLKNDLEGVAWKVTNFQIYAKATDEIGALPLGARLCTDMRGLTTQTAAGTANLDWDSNQVLAISHQNAAGQFQIIEPDRYVVTDLYVDNCTSFGVYYLIELEMYSITADEQIIYQLKQTGQDTP